MTGEGKPTVLQPAGWPAPRGYANGRRGDGEVVHTGGQIGWDEHGAFTAPGLVPQFAQALDNVLAVVRAAGGEAADVARLTVYVVDKAEYAGARREIGQRWRELMGRHYPAILVVQSLPLKLSQDRLRSMQSNRE